MAARAALAAAPAGLLTDLDGTLSQIADDPAAAELVPGAAAALETLAGRLAVVSVISGRAAGEAHRLLANAGPELLVVGNHGLEWMEAGADAPARDPSLEPIRTRISATLGGLPPLPGVDVEDKGLSATVHYRRAADPAEARRRLRAALAGAATEGLEVREGRMSLELRAAAAGDKGTAVRRIAGQFGLRGLLVAGDDVTDLDMFAAARALRAEGAAVAVIAIAGGREVPPAVSGAADVVLEDPATFARLLARLADGA